MTNLSAHIRVMRGVAWCLVIGGIVVLPLFTRARAQEDVTLQAEVDSTEGLLPDPVLNSGSSDSCGTSNTLSWTVVVGPGESNAVQEYSIERSDDVDFTSIAEASDWSRNLSYTFTDLSDGTHYYRVHGREILLPDNLSGYSNTESVRQVLSAAPAVPTIANIPTGGITNQTEYAFSGSKDAYASLLVNDEEQVGHTASTTWVAIIPLFEGTNEISVTSQEEACAVESVSNTYSVIRDTEAPVITARARSKTKRNTITVLGTKSADSNVLLGGEEVIATNADTTWEYKVDLERGMNRFTFTSQDLVGNESERVYLDIMRERDDSTSTDETGEADDEDIDSGSSGEGRDTDSRGTDTGADSGADSADVVDGDIENASDTSADNPEAEEPDGVSEPDQRSGVEDQPAGDDRDSDADTTEPEIPEIDTSEDSDRESRPVVSLPKEADIDKDGIADVFEKKYFDDLDTLIRDGDFDGDGLSDVDEYVWTTDPTRYDTDSDGLDDGDEVHTYRTNPNRDDSDSDTFGDGIEIYFNTNARDQRDRLSDDNHDGITDEWIERFYGVPMSSAFLGEMDTDGDGITDLEEYFFLTDPTRSDTDNDGVSDRDEIDVYGTNPLDAGNNPETQGIVIRNLIGVKVVADTTPLLFGNAPSRGKLELRAFPSDGRLPFMIGEVRAKEGNMFLLDVNTPISDGTYQIRAYLVGSHHRVYKKSPMYTVVIQSPLAVDPPRIDELGGRRVTDVLINEIGLRLYDSQPQLLGTALPSSEVSVIWETRDSWSVTYAVADSETGMFMADPISPLENGMATVMTYQTTVASARSPDVRIPFEISAMGSISAFLNPLSFIQSRVTADTRVLVAATVLSVLLLILASIRAIIRSRESHLAVMWEKRREQYFLGRVITFLENLYKRLRAPKEKYEIKRKPEDET